MCPIGISDIDMFLVGTTIQNFDIVSLSFDEPIANLSAYLSLILVYLSLIYLAYLAPGRMMV